MEKGFYRTMITFFVVSASLLIAGCVDDMQQIYDEDTRLLSRSRELDYIDIDLSKVSQKDTTTYSLYIEARNRVDQYVELKDGQYVLTINDGEAIKISENLFEQFKQIIANTNANIKENIFVETGAKTVQIFNKNASLHTPRMQSNRIETGKGGVTKVVVHWYGFDVYISHEDLLSCKTVSGLVGVVAAFCGQAEIVLLAGICYLYADDWYNRYPSGVILSLVYNPIIPGSCVPYDVSEQ